MCPRSRHAARRCSAGWPPGNLPTSRRRSQATRPKSVRTYKPDLDAKRTYDQVYEIYRRLYELLGRSEVGLLHGLKRIRTSERSES